MNPLLHWLTSPEWTHVVGALLHSLWQGAVIALGLAVLMRRLANPVTRYRCALVTLGLVVMAGIVTWAVLNAPKSAVSIAITIPVTEPAVTLGAITTLNPDSTDKVFALGRMPLQPAPKYWIAWLAVAWMLGAVAMLLRAGIKVAGAENLRRSCQVLNDERMITLVAEARRAVGLVRQVRVAVTDKLTSPAVVGVIVPTLILPLSLFTTLTPEQIRFILLHELAHIRRGDYFANLFQLLAEALLFFNPAVWWISHQIRREREACCDALAIELSGAPADYARTLVRVAENILQPATSAALAFGDGQREPSSLADRVQRLLVPGYRPALRLTWRAMLVSLIVGGMLLVLSAVGTRSTVGAILSPREKAASEPLISSPLTNFGNNSTTTPVPATFTGIMTDPQFREVVKAINQRSGINSPNEDQVTQLSDRRAQILISAVDKNSIATEIENQPGHIGAAETTTDNFTNQATNSTFALPTTIDKVPILGDLPLVGRLFRSESSNLIPKVVVHSDDPFWTITETYTSATPTNPTTIQQRFMRYFNIDLNAFYAAVRKSAGLPETTTGTNLTAAIRPFFAKAVGVHFDQNSGNTYFLSTSRGQMMIYATLPELDAIEVLLSTMKGTPLVVRTYTLPPDSLAKSVNRLAPAISSALATNPAVGFRALLESFDPSDPRPKQVHYNPESKVISARATEADLDKFESALPVLRDTNLEVLFQSKSASSDPVDLANRTFMVGPVEMARALGHVGAVQVTNAAAMVQEFMVKVGVDLTPPKTVVFKDLLGLLMVRATKSELDTIEKFLVQANQGSASGKLSPGNPDEVTAMIPVPEAKLVDSVRESSTNLQMWVYKIDANTMAQVLARQYDTNAGSRATTFTNNSLLLPEIQKLLASGGVDLQPPKSVFFNAPKGELLVFATKADSDTIGKILIPSNQGAASGKLSPGNTGEARAMIPVPKANPTGSVEESSTNLLLRVYTVDAKAMAQVLEAVGTNVGPGAKSTKDGRTLLLDIQKVFASLGVDLQPPKAVFFNEPKGQLLVRATQSDLDIIDQVVQVLNEQPSQVNLRAMFVEVPGDGSGDTFLGNLISLPPQSKRNASGKEGAISASAFTASNVFTGILTEPQFKSVLTALEERKDIKILSRQDVTTLSGRQAQMQTVEMRSIVTGLRTNLTPGETKGQVKTEQLPFGPVLDVIPFVSSDGHTIAMTVIPTVTEFLGYDEPQKNITDYAKSKNMPAALPLPRFRLRQVTTSANVWDGQTLVLGGFVAQEVIRKPDGSEVRQRSDKAEKRSLFVFITPTIIDPAGNRANPVEESPPSSPPTSK